LEWKDVNLEENWWHIEDPKNGHEIPMQEVLLLTTLERDPEPVSAPVRDPMGVSHRYKNYLANVKPRK